MRDKNTKKATVMPSRRAICALGACALLALCLSLSGCGKNGMRYDAQGTFEATEVVVSSEATGKILSFSVTEGQSMAENEAVGIIDDVQLVLKRRQLLASIGSVESKRPDIGVQIAATQQQIDTAETEKRRVERLLASDAASAKQLDDITAQIGTLRKQLAAQRASLEQSSRGITGESAALEFQVAQLDDQIRKCAIASPIAGTVIEKYAERGEIAVSGKALFKVADLTRMNLRAYVTSAQLSGVTPGDSVRVFAESGESDEREYAGTVLWISDRAEFTPKTIQTRDERANLVYAMKIAVLNDGFIRIGMYGSVRFADNGEK